MGPAARRKIANASAVLLLAGAFFVALTGFRRPPGWVGVTQRITFASDHALPMKIEASENEASTAEPVILDQETLRRELEALRAHVRRRSSADWSHLPPGVHGDYVRERWCSPPLDRQACSVPGLEESEASEAEWFQLDLVRDPLEPHPEIGYVFRARVLSSDRAWAVRLSFARGGGQVVRSGFSIDVDRAGPGQGHQEELRLGTAQELRAGPLRCIVNAPGLPAHDGLAREQAVEAELGRLLASPDSLRATVSARLVDLLENAEAALDSPEASSRWCTLQEPAPGARAALVADLRRQIDQRQEIVDQGAAQVHALLLEALPGRELVGEPR